ncbi:MAG TPA: YqgE/AlgH family protein [Aestuariivirgaceae bacterium]|jgi:putative transcriptional regulator|nr:YqgE/AlgH family protein [Aestuariivirgaceae bacterium]
MTDANYLDGKMLIAMPGIGDPRFERTVIFLCVHSADGAMGLVVNKAAEQLSFPELLRRLDLLPQDERINLPRQVLSMKVQIGGPVESGRGFVLHTSDYHAADSTLPIDESIGLTATLDVLRAIAAGAGPRQALLALGYAGWGPGQLEREIQHNGWLHCATDETLLFDTDLDAKYELALRKLGIDPSMLTSYSGHA